jgi:hypothetical protein
MTANSMVASPETVRVSFVVNVWYVNPPLVVIVPPETKNNTYDKEKLRNADCNWASMASTLKLYVVLEVSTMLP